MISFTIPGESPSTPNLREHWRSRAKRAKVQRAKAMLKCPKWKHAPLLVVTLTRFGVRELDSHDNLRAALKPYVDGIASRLRVDDSTKLVDWQYEQAKCSKGDERVEVAITLATRAEHIDTESQAQ